MSDKSGMLPETIIRLARNEERVPLVDLQRTASLVSEEYREQLLANPDAIDLPLEQIKAGQVHVAERQGMILGFCVVLPRPDGDAELDGLFVEPAAWNKGIGRLLVAHAERIAASSGAKFLCVIANPEALGFYTSCTFELVGEEQTRFGTALTMRKKLSSA